MISTLGSYFVPNFSFLLQVSFLTLSDELRIGHNMFPKGGRNHNLCYRHRTYRRPDFRNQRLPRVHYTDCTLREAPRNQRLPRVHYTRWQSARSAEIPRLMRLHHRNSSENGTQWSASKTVKSQYWQRDVSKFSAGALNSILAIVTVTAHTMGFYMVWTRGSQSQRRVTW